MLALTVAIELVQNNSMMPEHALPVMALGSMVVLLNYSLASDEYNGEKRRISIKLSCPSTQPIIWQTTSDLSSGAPRKTKCPTSIIAFSTGT
jgi:hypothetical protein